jgi:hypothetical protein
VHLRSLLRSVNEDCNSDDDFVVAPKKKKTFRSVFALSRVIIVIAATFVRVFNDFHV